MAQEARTALPLPDPAFKGKIGKTFADSKEDFPLAVHAQKGAPNVVVILIDDLGFGRGALLQHGDGGDIGERG